MTMRDFEIIKLFS